MTKDWNKIAAELSSGSDSDEHDVGANYVNVMKNSRRVAELVQMLVPQTALPGQAPAAPPKGMNRAADFLGEIGLDAARVRAAEAKRASRAAAPAAAPPAPPPGPTAQEQAGAAQEQAGPAQERAEAAQEQAGPAPDQASSAQEQAGTAPAREAAEEAAAGAPGASDGGAPAPPA